MINPKNLASLALVIKDDVGYTLPVKLKAWNYLGFSAIVDLTIHVCGLELVNPVVTPIQKVMVYSPNRYSVDFATMEAWFTVSPTTPCPIKSFNHYKT